MRAGDEEAVAERLGHPPRGAYEVAVRDEEGLPAVIENAPFLDDGTPMPTRFWLVDRRLCHEVARIEAAGGVAQAESEVDPATLAAAHQRYAAERGRRVGAGGAPAPSGGVGGTRRGVKCLHAHLAWWLAGGEDPVGAWTARHLGLIRRRDGCEATYERAGEAVASERR